MTFSTSVIEVVIYTIKPDMIETFKAKGLPVFRKLVESFPGFVSYETATSVSEPGRYIDIVRGRGQGSSKGTGVFKVHHVL